MFIVMLIRLQINKISMIFLIFPILGLVGMVISRESPIFLER